MIRKILLCLLLPGILLEGCVMTKIVTVPMRVGGAVVSIIPVAGSPLHYGIDKAADTVDKIPF
jgi:hypothetical protein